MKKYPYIRFHSSQWLAGTVSFQSNELAGIYIKLCCFYWTRECNLPREQVKTIVGNHYNDLLKSGLIKCKNDRIYINWLDEQYEENEKKRKINIANGRKGGQAKANARKSLSNKNIKEKNIEENNDPYLTTTFIK